MNLEPKIEQIWKYNDDPNSSGRYSFTFQIKQTDGPYKCKIQYLHFGSAYDFCPKQLIQYHRSQFRNFTLIFEAAKICSYCETAYLLAEPLKDSTFQLGKCWKCELET